MDGLILSTAMAGVILVVAVALRAGRLIALVPEAVIDGFTIGIATIIAASQFQDALGLSAGQVPADMIPKMQALWAVRGTLSLTALGLTAATVAAILLLRRWRPTWPVLVIAVAAASLAGVLLHLPVGTEIGRAHVR